MKRRPPGTGSIYQRNSDGRWMAKIREDGKRRVVSAKTRERLLERLAERGIEWDASPPRPATRAEQMAVARMLGTHTEMEWWALIARSPKECRYCAVELVRGNMTKDHKVPVARGGSDAINNLQVICWECNMDKRDQMPDEYTYRGPRPRPYRTDPKQAAATKRRLAARGVWRG